MPIGLMRIMAPFDSLRRSGCPVRPELVVGPTSNGSDRSQAT